MCQTARKADCFPQSSIICQSSAASYADNLQSSNSGYTLVELMVAVMLAAVASAGIYQGYTSFSASYDVQEQVAEQNQNLRMSMQKMVKDIRMAGYTKTAGAGFTAINSNNISFTVLNDTTGNLDTITYTRNGLDSSKLDRIDTGAPSLDNAIIDNVQALNFVYLDQNRNPTATFSAVRYVQIALVVKTTNEDYTYTHDESYYSLAAPPPAGPAIFGPQGDHFRRRLLTADVECRNMAF